MNGLNKGFLRKVIKMMCQTPGLYVLCLFVPQMLTWGRTLRHFVPKVGRWTIVKGCAILNLIFDS